MFSKLIIQSYQQAKRFVIIVVGFTVLLFGIIMIPLPGPGFLVIIGALAILAAEFVWAKRLLRRFKKTASHITSSRNAARFLKFAQTKIGQKVFNLFARR
jgi:tellurite resistance protein TerC